MRLGVMVALGALLALALSSPAGRADQGPAVASPLRATIISVGAGSLTARTSDHQSVTVVVTPATKVDVVSRRAIADLKPGAYVGVSALTGKDGTLHGQEVHIFADAGLGEGHRAMGNNPNQTMTNATIAKISAGGAGTTLTLDYRGGEQQIIITPQTPIIALRHGALAELKAGMPVTVIGKTAPGGGTTALIIIAGQNGAKPAI